MATELNLKLGDQVHLSTNTPTPRPIGYGVYLGNDLVFLRQAMFAQASRFIVDTTGLAFGRDQTTEFELKGPVQAYIDNGRNMLMQFGAPGHAGRTVSFEEITTFSYGVKRVVAGAAYLEYRRLWLILENLPLPKQNPFLRVA